MAENTAGQMHDPFFPEANHPLRSIVVQIHYASAKAVAEFLSKNAIHLLSADGDVEADERTNALFLRDHATNILEIKKIISALDVPQPEILIKARLINVDDDFTRSLGVLFASKQKNDTTNNSSGGDFDIPILKLNDGNILEAELSALEQAGHAKTISKPELITMSRQAAVIESGDEIPYQESTVAGGTSVVFKKAALRLKVIPTLMPHQRIFLELTINQDKVSAITVNGMPAITTQQLQTQALIKNRQTIVLGGIFEQSHVKETAGVPGFDQIPVAGSLFKRRKNMHDRKELLILITPEIINENQRE